MTSRSTSWFDRDQLKALFKGLRPPKSPALEGVASPSAPPEQTASPPEGTDPPATSALTEPPSPEPASPEAAAAALAAVRASVLARAAPARETDAPAETI